MPTLVRSLLLSLGLSLTACAAAAPPPRCQAEPPTATSPKKFSMRMYQMAILRRGPRWSGADTPERKALLKGHMDNIKRLGAEGKPVIAGPFDIEDTAPPETPVGIF